MTAHAKPHSDESRRLCEAAYALIAQCKDRGRACGPTEYRELRRLNVELLKEHLPGMDDDAQARAWRTIANLCAQGLPAKRRQAA